MISSINPVSLDLYGLSISPPTIRNQTSPCLPSSISISNDLNSSIDVTSLSSTLNKEEQDSPVIYPWMRKVHINNPG